MGIESAIKKIKEAEAKNTSELDLGNEELTDNCLSKLLDKLSSSQPFFDRLVSLTLSHNKLKTVPYSVCKWKNLKRLLIDYNDISINREILKAFERLEELSISNNAELVVPEGISDLKNLKRLFLDEDQFITSIEALVSLRNVSIGFIDKISLRPITFNFDQIQSTNVFKRLIQNYKNQQAVILQNQINKKDENLKQEETLKATLDEKATNLKIFSEVAFLMIILVGIFLYYPIIADNWNIFEPRITIISALVTVGLAALYILNKQKPYWHKIDQGLQNISERVIYVKNNFKLTKYLEKTQEIEKLKMNLKDYLEQ